MRRRGCTLLLLLAALAGLWLGFIRASAQPSAAAVEGFETYAAAVEHRVAEQHRAAGEMLAAGTLVPANAASLREGELLVERLSPAGGAPGAMLHHWRGTMFVAGARAANLTGLLRDFEGYPKRFAPEVQTARQTAGAGDRVQAVVRVKQKHGLTVVLDTTYDVGFGAAPGRGWSTARSLRVEEIEGAETKRERALSEEEAHGFLWRMTTWWSYVEGDGGLYVQVESVSLSRAVPAGLGWVVRPFVESVPRESLQFTLRAVEAGLR